MIHVEHLPAEEQDCRILHIVLHLARSLYFLGSFQEIQNLLLQHQKRLERLQDPSLAGPYYFLLGHVHSYLGDQEQAARSAKRAVEEATRYEDKVTLGKAYYLLMRVGFWLCQFSQGIEHGRQATSLLEQTEERWWLGQSYCFVGLIYYLMGEFELALGAETRVQSIGEAIEDPRLQTYAAWAIGLIYATRGDWEAGIKACQQSLERSPDPLNTAIALGLLGIAHLEKGDPSQASLPLEQSIQQLGQFGFRPLRGWLMASLGETYLLHGQFEKARDLATQGLEITKEAKFPYGIGLNQRVLGRIAHFGIIIRMFAETGAQHHAPHLHAYYQEHQAVYSIDPIQLIAGTLPRQQQRLVEAWVELYQGELIENWNRIEVGQPVNKVPPLRRG